jgi:PAS domain-containing protein
MHVNYTQEASRQPGDAFLLNHHHPEVEGQEFVVFTDSARRYVDCTDGVCRLLGYSRGEMLARTIDSVSFHEDQVPRLFAEYLERGQLDGEFVLKDKSGKPLPIRYRAFVFHDGCAAAVWEPIKDWRGIYLAALVEVDPVQLKRKIEIALAAVQQRAEEVKRLHGGPHPEEQSLRDAASALQSLKRNA